MKQKVFPCSRLIVSRKPRYINETKEKLLIIRRQSVGKGRRPAVTTTKTVTVTTRSPTKKPTEGTEAGGRAQKDQPQQCWTFLLENPEKGAIREVSVGAPVLGQVVASAILVTAPSLGPLGRAPAGVSRQMIIALQEEGGGLGGEVIELFKSTVKVRLCLQ
jgi:hypothetical protein